jgi:hypothetical protein
LSTRAAGITIALAASAKTSARSRHSVVGAAVACVHPDGPDRLHSGERAYRTVYRRYNNLQALVHATRDHQQDRTENTRLRVIGARPSSSVPTAINPVTRTSVMRRP